MSTEELTEEQRKLVDEFRERVLDIVTEETQAEWYLQKWLIARKWDLNLAEDMLRKHYRFMQLNGLDKIDEDFVPSKATDYFHTKMLGYDKEGSVVRILHLGACDLKGLVASLSKADCLNFAAYSLIMDSRKQRKDRENDTICHKQVYIFDLKGLNYRTIIQRPIVERAFALLRNYEMNYPESLKIVYVLNAPTFFGFINNWLRTFLPETVLSKVYLLSQDNCKAVLSEKIDPAILPVSVGGTMVDETKHPECPSMYKKPLYGPVPEELMLYHQFEVLDKDPLALKAVVEAGYSFKVDVVITEAMSIIQWDFQTLNYDICLGLNFKGDKDPEWKRMIPTHRVESHRIPESGHFLCQEPGVCELVFDNTYSWLNKKELVYKITVVPPLQAEKDT